MLETTPTTPDDIRRQAIRFAREDRRTTWRLLLVTLALLSAAIAAALWLQTAALAMAAGLLVGLLQLRLFAFFHDAQHGAIFADSSMGRAIMGVVGVYLLTPHPIWRDSHNYHHRNNAKLTGSQIGSYPLVTRRTWNGLTARQRLRYRLVRHPANIVLGYFTVFIFGMALAPFLRQPRRHWLGAAALLLHFGAFAALWLWYSPVNAFFAIVFPLMVSTMVGSYLFFVQHNFPDQFLNTRDQWSYKEAALRSSSMFDMHPVMHWFTGNIGYHHVHHLNAHIPFYRLPEAMASIVALQNPGRTSWKPADMLACLRIGAWDPDIRQPLTYSALQRMERSKSAPA